MTNDAQLEERTYFPTFIARILDRHQEKKVEPAAVYSALKNSLSIATLINNLAEVFRLSREQIERDLQEFGFQDLIDLYRLKNAKERTGETKERQEIILTGEAGLLNPFPEIFRIDARPELREPIAVDRGLGEILRNLFTTVPSTFAADPFLRLYREDVYRYYEEFVSDMGPRIREAIRSYFGENGPKYMITTGIGANEQFTHFVAAINNRDANRRLTWIIANSPKSLAGLPADAALDNTLFVEFSRSSITEETVKIHEYTPRNAKRIVFSNQGPLKEAGIRDGNLVLQLPDAVAGRFGRNKTPILLAPMYIAGMDAEAYWRDIERAIRAFDVQNPDSLPCVLAKFILLHQKESGKNLIYLGCNDDTLLKLADEFVQYWNESVNKGGNDLLLSRFFGLPRDSHMNIEGILGNRETKMGIFLLRTNMRPETRHPLVSAMIDPVNPEHQGLHYGDEEVVLAYANYRRFSELMPTILIEVPGQPTLRHSAILGQLFADLTYVYARFNSIDPGSNPEVKSVRERSAQLLAGVARKLREDPSLTIQEAVAEL